MAGNAQHLILKMRAHLGPPARFVWNGIPYNFRGTVMPFTENDPVWERVICHKANTKDFKGFYRKGHWQDSGQREQLHFLYR